MILEFRDDYFFLSNFYEAPVTYHGITYLNNEAAFQAQKTLDPMQRMCFAKYNPSQAKRNGRRVSLRPNWEDVKENIMYEICKAKFSQNENLKEKLLQTGTKYLEEGNNWGDTIWGTVDRVGENKLGKILMRVREELKNE